MFAACALLALAAGNVPDEPHDVDPDHSHTGQHTHDYPYHTGGNPGHPEGSDDDHDGDGHNHPLEDSNGHAHSLDGHTHQPTPPGGTGASGIRVIEQLDFNQLTSTRYMYGHSFNANQAVELAQTHAVHIAPLLAEVTTHADNNHPRDGTYRRGQYNSADPMDPTTMWIRNRFIKKLMSDPPPRVYDSLSLACRHANCLHESNREPGTTIAGVPDTEKQRRCLVGSADAMYGAIQCKCAVRPQQGELDFGEVVDEDTACQACAADGTDNCQQCGAEHYLHNGECFESCPEHHDSVGTGLFGRRCEALSCVALRDGCHRCHAVHDKCVVCRDRTYLHERECHAECPAGFEGVGLGRYRRRCREEADCRRNVDGCNTCTGGPAGNSFGTSCTQCKGGTSLHGGTCHQTCPPGYMTEPGVNPRSQYNRVCILELPASDCLASRDHCLRCDGYDPAWATMEADEGSGGSDDTHPISYYRGWHGDECMTCRDAWYLHEGVCVESCPPGTLGDGNGVYNRVCLA